MRHTRLLALTLCCFTSLMAQNPQEDMSEKNPLDFFGATGIFSRFGFNDKYDPSIGAYPTDSVASLYTELNLRYNMLSHLDSSSMDTLSFVVGGAFGGIGYDSTRNDNDNDDGGLGYWYSGYYGGYLGNEAATPLNTRNFVMHNGFFHLKSKGFEAKLGRYKSTMDQQSAYTQGFNIDYTTHIGSDSSLKVWGFGSYGRAYAYAQWIYDWYSELTTDFNKDGKADANLGKYAFGIDFVNGSLQENTPSYSLLIRPYIYFYPEIFEAIGGRMIYESNVSEKLSIKAQMQGFYLHIHDAFVKGKFSNQSPIDPNSTNLNIVLEATYSGYNMGLGYYQNFGSANAYFGGYPIYIDIWTASLYDIGRSKSDMVNRNAQSFYLITKKDFTYSFGKIHSKILARYTQSPRSDETSVALYLGHTFKNNLSIGCKLEYLSDTTKAGYKINGTELKNTRIDDRSHAFLTFDHGF